MPKEIHIAFTGGGTGGHVYPLLAVAEELKQIAEIKKVILNFHYFGRSDEYTKEFEVMGAEIHTMLTGKFRRYFSLLTILDIPKFFIGTLQVFWKMFWVMPDVVFSKGGAGALPTVWAAWWYRVPVIIHESDAAPSVTTLLTARFAKRIGVSFESTLKFFHPQKSFCPGNPIRPSLLVHREIEEDAKQALGFDEAKPLLLVVAGSQGAKSINDFIALHLPLLLGTVQILHQTGKRQYDGIKKLTDVALQNIVSGAPGSGRYEAVPYLDASILPRAYSAADIVLARAGSSIFEFAAFGLPMILIPLPGAAQNHQRENARAVAEKGAAVEIEEENLSEHIVLREIKQILEKPEVRDKMEQASTSFSRPKAARIIAEEVFGLVE